MAINCPFCQKELKDGAKFCTGCGRQIGGEVEAGPASAVSDLKCCYGSYPHSNHVECYLCADEPKCFNLTSARNFAQLGSLLEALSRQLEAIHDRMAETRYAVAEGFKEANSLLYDIKRNTARIGGG